MSGILQDKTAVVTGAGSGIGRAIALMLARAGAKVILVGRRVAVLEAVARKCGPLAVVYPCDVTDDLQVAGLLETIQHKSPEIDVFVHSAGSIKLGAIESSPVADFEAQFAANVRAAYVLTQAMLPGLRLASGQVVFINSSITQARETSNRGAFAATQHALRSFANSLRDEVNTLGIRVTTIYPGSTATPRQVHLHEGVARSYDPSRMLQPEDVAEAVLFAISAARTAEITDLYLRPMQKPIAAKP